MNSFLARWITWLIDLFYLPQLRRFIPQHTFRYLVCGVGNYLVLDTILYFVLYNYVVEHRYFDAGVMVISPHVAAMVLVFPVTFLIGFWLNRYVAFNATAQRAKVQIAKYALSIVGSIVVSYVVLKVLVEVCGVWATPAKGASSVITAMYSYLMARYFTFGKGDKR